MSNDAEILQQDIAQTASELSQLLTAIRDITTKAEQDERALIHLTVLVSDVLVHVRPGKDGDPALYVESAGGMRRLPDPMSDAIRALQRYLGIAA